MIWAERFGRYPSCSMWRWTRFLVAGEMRGLLLTTMETVATETPAALATSWRRTALGRRCRRGFPPVGFASVRAVSMVSSSVALIVALRWSSNAFGDSPIMLPHPWQRVCQRQKQRFQAVTAGVNRLTRTVNARCAYRMSRVAAGAQGGQETRKGWVSRGANL